MKVCHNSKLDTLSYDNITEEKQACAFSVAYFRLMRYAYLTFLLLSF